MTNDLEVKLVLFRDSLGNPDSKALITSALEELSRRQWIVAAQFEALKGAAAKLDASRSLLMATGGWRNSAGYLTDAAIWIEMADEQVSEALSLTEQQTQEQA